jgi:hypothetical protein
MPWMQAVVERANERFNRKNIESIDPTLLAPGKTLLSAAVALEIVQNDQEIQQFSLWPSSLMASVQATLYDAVSRDERVPVQFSWTPAAGFGVGAWEAAGVGGSYTAITVELKSPLPAARRNGP